MLKCIFQFWYYPNLLVVCLKVYTLYFLFVFHYFYCFSFSFSIWLFIISSYHLFSATITSTFATSLLLKSSTLSIHQIIWKYFCFLATIIRKSLKSWQQMKRKVLTDHQRWSSEILEMKVSSLPITFKLYFFQYTSCMYPRGQFLSNARMCDILVHESL